MPKRAGVPARFGVYSVLLFHFKHSLVAAIAIAAAVAFVLAGGAIAGATAV